ncbi:hypothetical protein M8C21_012939 [Ambrosia artemisiifolia]|uniref:Uncharacterized protein n=1 Tax=Ambrosia artemisiifolia TaxID=4212 RepID=A0AAD5GSE4_AMBAR|nr:hypothetical protein M8C21_012939 [Ambrosia artemisiifolia]
MSGSSPLLPPPHISFVGRLFLYAYSAHLSLSIGRDIVSFTGRRSAFRVGFNPFCSSFGSQIPSG